MTRIQTSTLLKVLLLAALFAVVLIFPSGSTFAASSDLKISGWIPYWQDTLGVKSAKKNLRDLDTIHPFAFSVKSDGTLEDLADLDESKWRSLFRSAERRDVEVIPTIMWSDGAQIHAILSDEDRRRAHIEAIVEMVGDGDFDGVDIDYEAKLAETIDYFSLFLEELRDELRNREILTCTVEARMPPESRFREVPAVIEYANDYEEMAKHCDRIEIMAYDQQRADLLLNEERAGEPYFPVADIDWVREVVEFALEDIPAEKIVLGIPTYGYHYRVTVSPNWYQSYERLGALNMPDLLDIADEYDVTPGRTDGGELSFTYFPDDSPYRVLEALPVPKGTRKGGEAAAQALLFANHTGLSLTVNLGWYGDADSAEEKLDLAEELGLYGVAFFKIDGEEDRDIWRLF